MESPQRQKGLRMTIQLVRKSPIGKMNSKHLKIVLAGSHTMKQKACMLMQVRFSWVTSALRNICPIERRMPWNIVL